MIIIPIEDHISGYLNPPIDDLLFISRRLVEKTQVPQNSSGSKECLPRYASMARKIAVVDHFFFSQGPNPYLSHSQPFFLVNTPWSWEELYGFSNINTGEWTDGLVAGPFWWFLETFWRHWKHWQHWAFVESLASGKHTKKLWKITIFHGKIHYKGWFSIIMLNFQRVMCFIPGKHSI